MSRSGRRAAPFLALAALVCFAAGAPAQIREAPGASTQSPGIDGAALLRDVAQLASPSFEGRLTGSPGSTRAQAFILQRFAALGVQPLNGSHEQRFSFTPADRDRGGRAADARNILGLVPGTSLRDEYVVVSAHYDHLGIRNGQVYPGADDNASGVAALLALAGWFRAHPAPRSIVFAAFDGEEQGLQGSKHFVAHPPIPLSQIRAVINMDMLGRGDANVLHVAGTAHYPALARFVEEAARGRAIGVAFGHDRPGRGDEQDWTQSSDHAPFHAAGIPFLYFAVEDHRDYHQPSDTAERIPLRFYREAVEVVLSTVSRVAAAPGLGAIRRGAQGGTLTAQEQVIVAAVDAGVPEALALLERVVNINSGSMNFPGVQKVGEAFAAELTALGFATRWVDGAPFGRAGHLVAQRAGKGPRVLLIGHLDTVFEPASPFQRFERIDERTARGPGVIDMKGGDVVMVSALKALAAARALDGLQLTVVLTGDEELAGQPLAAARAALVQAGQTADIALGFENGPGNPRTAVIARRGAVRWKLRVTAKPGHSSQIFREDLGSGAIFEAARVLEAFRTTLAGEPHLTFNPGVILGGGSVELDGAAGRGTTAGKENVIAAEAVVIGDLRALSAAQFEHARTRMQQIAARALPHTEATLTFEEGYPPLAPAPGNERLLALYDAASRDVGAGPVTAVDPDRAGAADVSFIAPYVPMILDGIGLMGHSDHTPGETADLSTLPSQTKRAALLLHRISRGAAGL